jgi:pimeloyl-ACP methyl ester carboxylesterase
MNEPEINAMAHAELFVSPMDLVSALSLEAGDSYPPVFVLIHSPLVGPTTWQPVADEMRRGKLDTVVPTLESAEGTNVPYWRQHAEGVIKALENVPSDRPLILVAHSGGGMLLPAIRQVTGRPVAAYLFVDAMIPEDMKSRLDLFESKESAARFRQGAKDSYLPTWTNDDLREEIPNDSLRRRFVNELRPLPLAVYEEPIPVFAGWPDAPCGYLQFTPTYDIGKRRAESSGWAYARMDGGHFHMLADPQAVTTALIKMVDRLGVAVKREES